MEIYVYLVIPLLLALPSLLFCCCRKKEPSSDPDFNAFGSTAFGSTAYGSTAYGSTAFEVKYEKLLK